MDLIGVNPELTGQIGNRPVALDRRQRHLRLERRVVLLPCPFHILLLRHRRFLGAGLHLSLLSHFRGPAHHSLTPRHESCTNSPHLPNYIADTPNLDFQVAGFVRREPPPERDHQEQGEYCYRPDKQDSKGVSRQLAPCRNPGELLYEEFKLGPALRRRSGMREAAVFVWHPPGMPDDC